MQIDLDAVSESKEYTSTVCIIGAGIAGLLLARNLAARGIDVNLLEGGGQTLEKRSQDLYSAKMGGIRHDGTTRGRFRVFGGSSTRWGGQLLPYTPDVFSPPSTVPSVKWPITHYDLEPYYSEVHKVMHVGSGFPETEFFNMLGKDERDYPEIKIRFSKWAPFSKRNLANTVGRECLQNPRIVCFLHANATCIEPNKSNGRIERAIVKNYRGISFRFTAQQFVICTGTIESSRLLLASNTVCERGLGNSTDNVGRYFHDHISVSAAPVEGEARRQFVRLFSPRLVNGILFTPKLEASEELRSSHGLLAVMAHFSIDEPPGTGVAAVREILQSIQRRERATQMVQAVSRLPGNLREIARLLWFARFRKRRAISHGAAITLRLDCEQKPTAASRIRISAERDVLGMPRAVIDWHISYEEQRTVQTYARVIGNFLNKVGIKPIDWSPEIWKGDDSWLKLTTDTYHAMGGTRMGTDPKSSVVDCNLQVHGVPNLFVASCSVFPGGGSSNPTFTMMALTLRLGNYLANRCSGSARTFREKLAS
jgi:choline dehydrogenase-like flavoprotein